MPGPAIFLASWTRLPDNSQPLPSPPKSSSPKVTISDKYMFIGPVFNDVTTVGFTHPVVKDRLVEVQLDHVGIAGEVGNC